MTAPTKNGGPPAFKKRDPRISAEALPPLDAVLAELEDRRKKIDEADTQLSSLIAQAEKALQNLFSIRVSTSIDDPREASDVEHFLVFGKHDAKWQLLIESCNLNMFEGDDVKPLLSCSREIRLKIFTEGHLETLIRGAVAQLDKQLAVREDALKKARSLILDLGEVPF